MLNGNRVLASSPSWVVVALTFIIAALIPAGYLGINYSALASATDTETEILADAVSQVIIRSPELWRFQEDRLGDLLRRNRRGVENISARILDRDGAEVVSVGQPLGFFAIRRSADVFASGVRVGLVEERRPLLGLFLETAGAALLGALLGAVVFALLQRAESRRRQAEDALREKEYLLHEAQRIAHVGSWRYDFTESTLWSDELYRICGVSPDTFTPTVEAFVGLIHAEDRPAMQAWMAVCAAGGAPVEHEFRIIRSDGIVRSISGRGELMVEPGKGSRYVTCTAQDITERKRIAQELCELNASLEQRIVERTRQLEAASRAKSDFLANMSHELRTPLNAIIGFSEMLKEGLLGELDAKQRGFIADIFGAGTHLLSLINDILDLSKVEVGMMSLESEVVAVAALLKASTLIVREKANAHHIRLETQLDPALGSMLADERKLKQIVYNLLANAVKFSPDGGMVTLRAWRCARGGVLMQGEMPARLLPLPPGEDGEFLAIAVEDTGEGIAEALLPKLFEPFMQLDSSSTRRHAGTGLGLSLVRRLVELHGGTVGVASRPGVGSRFCVWLPYRAAPALAGN